MTHWEKLSYKSVAAPPVARRSQTRKHRFLTYGRPRRLLMDTQCFSPPPITPHHPPLLYFLSASMQTQQQVWSSGPFYGWTGGGIPKACINSCSLAHAGREGKTPG